MTGIAPDFVPDPKLRAYVKQKLQERLAQMGQTVTDDYLNTAVEHYSQAGSPLRAQYFKELEPVVAEEQRRAQFGGSPLDYAQRIGTDVMTGAARTAMSPMRALAWAGGRLGIPGADKINADMENLLQTTGSENTMGVRGLPENPFLAALQSTGSEMAGNMLTGGGIAGEAANATGNMLYNAAGKVPQSPILRMLGTIPGENIANTATVGSRAANIARAVPRAVATGMAGATASMPYEMFSSPQGVGMGLVMSALGAAGAGRSHVPEQGSAAEAAMAARAEPRVPTKPPGRFSSALDALLAEPPMGASAEPGAILPEAMTSTVPEIPGITPRSAPGPVPPQAEVQARNVSQVPTTPGQEVNAMFEAAQARAPQAPVAPPPSAPAPRPAVVTRKPRTGGDKVDFSKDPVQAKAAEDYFNALTPEKRLEVALNPTERSGPKMNADMVRVVNAANSINDLEGFMQRRVLNAAGLNPAKAAVETAAPVAQAGPMPRKGALTPKAEVTPAEASPAAPGQPVTPPPTETPVVQPATPSLQEQVAAMQAENAALRGAQPGPTPRTGKQIKLEPMAKAPKAEEVAPSTEAPIDTKVNGAWWDSPHAQHQEKVAMIQDIANKRQVPIDAEVMAKAPWEELAPRIRAMLSTADLPKAQEGGAPQKGAGFRRRAKSQPKSGPSAGDIPETDKPAKRIPVATRKPKKS